MPRSLSAALGLAAGLNFACSGAQPLPTRLSSPVLSSKTSSNDRSPWLHTNGLPYTAELTQDASRNHTVCKSHGGCSIVSPPLPNCGDGEELPPEYVQLRGYLEASDAYVELQNSSRILDCGNSYTAAMVVRQGETTYALHLQCRGDRTGWCCPYPLGTGVRVVGRRGVGRGNVILLDDARLCADQTENEPIEPEFQQATASLVDFGENPSVAVWTQANHVAIWELSKPAPQVLTDEDAAPVSCLTVSPDANYLFTINQNGNAALWGVANGRRIQSQTRMVAPAPAGAQRIEPDVSCSYRLMRKVRWSDTGSHLLTITNDGDASVWNTRTGRRQQFDQIHHAESVHDDFFSPDGRHVLLHTSTGMLEVRGVDDGTKVTATEGILGYWAPDGNSIVVEDARPDRARRYHMWFWQTNQTAWELDKACLGQLSADGRYFSAQSPCNGFEAVVLDATTGRERIRLHSEYRPIWNGVGYAPARYRDDVAFLCEHSLPPSRPLRHASSVAPPTLLALPSRQQLQIWAPNRPLRSFDVVTPPWSADWGFEGRIAWGPNGSVLASPHWIWSPARPGAVVKLDTQASDAQLIFGGDDRLLARWTWSMATHHTKFDATTSIDIFDTEFGRTLKSETIHRHASIRQGVLGMPSPVWLFGSEVLAQAEVGSHGVLRLIRPRDGAQLWLSVAIDGGSIQPVVLGDDGKYSGSNVGAQRVCHDLDRPSCGVPSKLAPNLLREFLVERTRQR